MNHVFAFIEHLELPNSITINDTLPQTVYNVMIFDSMNYMIVPVCYPGPVA